MNEATVITTEDFNKLNELILHLIDIKDFTTWVSGRIKEVVLNNPSDYVEDGYGVRVDEGVIDTAIEYIWNQGNDQFDVPTAVYDKVHEIMNKTELVDLEKEAEEILRDGMEYMENPMKALGLSNKDFL